MKGSIGFLISYKIDLTLFLFLLLPSNDRNSQLLDVSNELINLTSNEVYRKIKRILDKYHPKKAIPKYYMKLLV